jgi:hypothetical protein
MSIWARIRQFWWPPKASDHPLTEAEREERPPLNAYEEMAREAEEFVEGH